MFSFASSRRRRRRGDRHRGGDDADRPEESSLLVSPSVVDVVAKDKVMILGDTDASHNHHGSNDDDGIEVSLENANMNEECREESNNTIQHRMERQPVIDVQEQIQWKQQLYHCQFSITPPHASFLKGSSSREHRIPLSSVSSNINSNSNNSAAYLDALHRLQAAPVVVDEHTAVSQELTQLRLELKAIEKDKALLLSFKEAKPQQQEWDVQTLLRTTSNNVDTEERRRLQRKRGNYLSVRFQRFKTKEVFLAKCGATLSLVKPPSYGDCVLLGPHNCKYTTQMQHVAIMSNHHTKLFKTCFYFALDTTTAATTTAATSNNTTEKETHSSASWGRLPPKLLQRMQDNSKNNNETTNNQNNIVYLSTGPQGLYFAEFQSGESWWNCPDDDSDLHKILEDWDLRRVVFGPMEVLHDDRGRVTRIYSWIVISKCGKVAWKNLPTRLHNRLKQQGGVAILPTEVSLGPAKSFFVRFLDNSIDYCLSAEMASVCDHIEKHGGNITNIALHPEVSQDYIIRHTELLSR